MRGVVRWLIQAYRLLVSPLLPRHCRFYPTCSAYALEAFEHYSTSRATLLTVKRLAKCHPWHAGGYDPLPMRTPPTDEPHEARRRAECCREHHRDLT